MQNDFINTSCEIRVPSPRSGKRAGCESRKLDASNFRPIFPIRDGHQPFQFVLQVRSRLEPSPFSTRRIRCRAILGEKRFDLKLSGNGSLLHIMIFISNSKAFVQETSSPESFKLRLFSHKIRPWLCPVSSSLLYYSLPRVE